MYQIGSKTIPINVSTFIKLSLSVYLIISFMMYLFFPPFQARGSHQFPGSHPVSLDRSGVITFSFIIWYLVGEWTIVVEYFAGRTCNFLGSVTIMLLGRPMEQDI